MKYNINWQRATFNNYCENYLEKNRNSESKTKQQNTLHRKNCNLTNNEKKPTYFQSKTEKELIKF